MFEIQPEHGLARHSRVAGLHVVGVLDDCCSGVVENCDRVTVKERFQPKAKKAYNRCLEAIESEGKASANKKWREVFGTSAPLASSTMEAAGVFIDTEEFIEDKFQVDITHSVTIDCEVTQDGWRPASLREMLRGSTPLMANKGVKFKLTSCTVVHPYEVKWKVLNRGAPRYDGDWGDWNHVPPS